MDKTCNPTRCLHLVAACCLALVFLAWGGPASAAAPPKPSCVTAKCHATMGMEKYVHGPAAVGDCTYCHQQTGKHQFKPIKDVGSLCYQCHNREDKGKHVHPPVKDGECTGCHDPHQSPYQFQLRAAGEDLCFLCHDKPEIVGKKSAHSPVEEGGCSSCHNPHSSDYPKMLMAAGNDVCFSCHDAKLEESQTKKHTHDPVAEACTNCHSPHSADYEYNLIGEPTQGLCFMCHDDKQEEIQNDKVKHAGLDTPEKCLACHDPHYSDNAKQLTMQPMNLCLNCHSPAYDDGNGKNTANMAAILKNNKFKHGPILEKDCTSCHNPHGSDNFRILVANFTPVFYSSYDPKNFELCFMCHEKDLASTQYTTTMTGFRNGQENLHYVHVNKRVKGRTCRACHDAHATNNPRHIRDAVPFGSWGLPVGYTKTDTGGQCQSGCHQLFKYDRKNPVKNR